MSTFFVVVCTLTLVTTLMHSGMTTTLPMTDNDKTASKFSEEYAICDVKDRIERGCSVVVPFTRGRVDCFSQCGSDKSCIGASVDLQTSECYHHRECPILPTTHCSKIYDNHQHMTKHCRHGFWDDSTNACVCVDGAFGERCDQYHTKCKDLAVIAGYPPGHHRVYIDPEKNGKNPPFLAPCDIGLDNKFTAIYLLRNRGVEDFNKTWNDYVNGFYYDWQSHWIGLYPLHRLSNAGFSKIFFVLIFKSRTNTNVHRIYFNFHVSDETARYSFTFGSISNRKDVGDVPPGSYFGDCLHNLKDAPFSTWDADNDDVAGENCAAMAGSGWWYNGCDNPCNALGFGMQFKGSVSARQLMSLMGVQLDSIQPAEEFEFAAYIQDNK